MKKKRRNLVNDIKYHYTYRITNIKEGMYYYGVHSCDCLPKEDIGVQYFSSSKNKEFIQDQKQNPENYKYKVLNTFSTRQEANKHEQFLHKKFNVRAHEKFYNKCNANEKFDTTGKGIFVDEDGKTILIEPTVAKKRGLKGVNTGKTLYYNIDGDVVLTYVNLQYFSFDL